MAAQFEINGRKIDSSAPVFMVAEMSANHGQSYEQAVRLIHAAKEAGADAVKLQTYTPDTMTIDCDNDYFRIGKGTVWEGRNLYDLYGEAYTPWEWQPDLKKEAEKLGLTLFSTPFDHSAVDFLEEMGVPAYKIASFEIVDLPLLRKVARTGKPVILSTGMSTLKEIDEALRTLAQAGADRIALLKCTSAYPALPEEMNLNSIPFLAGKYRVPVGLSDHTLSPVVPVVAAALGACIVEKHFTLSRALKGPDTEFSLEPEEFSQTVQAVRTTEKALGKASFELQQKEKASRAFRRSIFTVRDVKKAEELTSENIRIIRPGNGLHPRHLDRIIGKKASKDIPRGTPLDWSLVE